MSNPTRIPSWVVLASALMISISSIYSRSHADEPARGEIGRYQIASGDGTAVLLDTVTGRMWRNNVIGNDNFTPTSGYWRECGPAYDVLTRPAGRR
jgi:hypothetical protein